MLGVSSGVRGGSQEFYRSGSRDAFRPSLGIRECRFRTIHARGPSRELSSRHFGSGVSGGQHRSTSGGFRRTSLHLEEDHGLWR